MSHIALRVGKPEVVCLEDMACIMDTATQEDMDPGEWFINDVVRDCGGAGEAWKAKSLGHDKVEILESYDDLVSTHEPGKSKLQLGSGGAVSDVEVYIFRRQRIGGARVYYGLHDIYHALGLKTFQGEPSKWIYESKKSWTNKFQEFVSQSVE